MLDLHRHIDGRLLYPNLLQANDGKLFGVLDGRKCFRLVDTFGMPFDMLQELLHERNLKFNWLEFCQAACEAGWPMDRLKALADEHFGKVPGEVLGCIAIAYSTAEDHATH